MKAGELYPGRQLSATFCYEKPSVMKVFCFSILITPYPGGAAAIEVKTDYGRVHDQYSRPNGSSGRAMLNLNIQLWSMPS